MAKDNERSFTWKEIALGILGVGGAIGIGIGIHTWFQNRKLMRIFNKAASEVSQLTTIDVQDAIVEQAVRQAASREVSRVVAKATRNAEGEIAQAAQKKVTAAVSESYKKIGSAVTDKISEEVAKLNKDKISEDVIEKAKELLAEKFDTRLDDIADTYAKQLKSTSKIYEAFAGKLGSEKGKSINLNL